MILVTGGTGLLGAHVLCKLAAQQKSVRAIYRTKSSLKMVQNVFSYYSKSPEVLFDSIEWVEADITDVPALDAAFKNVNQVYHCAANLSFNSKDYLLSRTVNVVGTANIVNLCLSHNIEKLCHVSSIATLGEDTTAPIKETTPWNPENNKHNIYAITKYDAELEVWRGVQEGLDVIIVNPGVILGSGFWNSGTGEIFKKVANGFKYTTSGTVGVVDVNDVAKTMIRLTDSNIVNEQFIVVSENITYRKLIETIAKSLGKSSLLKEVKRWQLLVYLQLDKLQSILTSRKRSLYKANINSAFKTLKYDSSKLKNVLEFDFVLVTASVTSIVANYKKEH
ncbi:MAG: NAD-dependent epimerase/dehydratase family protein [Flavobacteriaceae bacterium]